MLNNAKLYFFLKEMNKKGLPAMVPLRFGPGVLVSVCVLLVFLALLCNHCYPFHTTKCTSSPMVPWYVNYFTPFPCNLSLGRLWSERQVLTSIVLVEDRELGPRRIEGVVREAQEEREESGSSLKQQISQSKKG